MIDLRPAERADAPFLWSVHRSAMKRYVEATWGWDEEFQREHFAERSRQLASIQIIRFQGQDIGFISVNRSGRRWFLETIEIQSQHQRKGVGTKLITDLAEDARFQRSLVGLQVLKVNPARALYERLGFRSRSESETHFVMEKAPR